jgi:WD40 repeat protein
MSRGKNFYYHYHLNLKTIVHPFLPILIEVDKNHSILITDTITKSNIYTLIGHSRNINFLKIDPIGLYLASCSYNTVRIWDLNTGFCINILQTDNEVRAISWNKSGSLIALGSDDKNINVWKTVTDKLPVKPYKTLVGHKKGILALVSNHSYDLLASSSEDKSIRIWKWTTGECIRWLSGYSSPISILETTETQLFGYESKQYDYRYEGIKDFGYYGVGLKNGIGFKKRLNSGEYNYIWSWSNINSGLGYMCEYMDIR